MALPTFSSALRQIRPGTLPSTAYASLQRSGVLLADTHQSTVLPLLDQLHAQVAATAQRGAAPPPAQSPRGGLWGSVFAAAARPASPAPPSLQRAGLYLWGGTGCGKTMLMDLFLACSPPSARAQRVHFHAFMQRVNAKLHAVRSSGGRGDPLAAVAQELLAEAWMLCFDELQVTDVGDALILRRLFDALHAGGLVMLATSNRAPSELYAGGLQRELFLPFVTQLTARCAVHHLASPTDHRLRELASAAAAQAWMSPDTAAPPGAAAAAVARAFEAAWAAAGAAGERECALDLPVEGQGRCMHVPRAYPAARAARLTFQQLCGSPLAAGDYAALTKAFDTVYLEAVPVLGMGERNELRRLITLVDILYDSQVRLVASAAASPVGTFRVEEEKEGQHKAQAPGSSGGAGRISIASSSHKAKYDELFAWDRTVSRLVEMQGQGYAQGGKAQH